jgi:hypothetical protein
VLLAAEGRSTRSIAESRCPAAHCQPLAAALCRARPLWAQGPPTGGQEADLRQGHEQAHSGASGEATACGLCPLLAKALADVDVQYVWRFLREHNIDLAARKSWCESNDPAFVAKAADVVGLYVDPPAKAIVLCVDEKPSIQALERAQGYLKLPNGRALTGQSHHYKRHGTTILCSQRSKSPPEGSSRRIPSGAVVSSSSASWTASLPPSRIVSFTSCGIRQSMPSRR